MKQGRLPSTPSLFGLGVRAVKSAHTCKWFNLIMEVSCIAMSKSKKTPERFQMWPTGNFSNPSPLSSGSTPLIIAVCGKMLTTKPIRVENAQREPTKPYGSQYAQRFWCWLNAFCSSIAHEENQGLLLGVDSYTSLLRTLDYGRRHRCH